MAAGSTGPLKLDICVHEEPSATVLPCESGEEEADIRADLEHAPVPQPPVVDGKCPANPIYASRA